MAKHVKKSETTQESEHGISTFTEYKLPPTTFCLGVSEISGRYPQSGTDADTEVEQIWYVEKGSGVVEVSGVQFELAEGDMLHIDKGEKFVIDGNLKLLVASSPIWTPEQHKHFD